MKIDTVVELRSTIKAAALDIARLEDRVLRNESERLDLLRVAEELGVEPGDLASEAQRIFGDVKVAVQSVQVDIAQMKAVTDA